MTPTDALREALAEVFGPDVDPNHWFRVTGHLWALGFTIVPIEPSDEQVEAMARTLCEADVLVDIDHLSDQEALEDWRPRGRAAYAAAIRETRRD